VLSFTVTQNSLGNDVHLNVPKFYLYGVLDARRKLHFVILESTSIEEESVDPKRFCCQSPFARCESQNKQ
jgi:hypothetical protein